MYIASPQHLPTISDLHEYWRSKCGDRRMPRRSDICPTEIPALLPMLFLVDLEHDPFRVRYRVVGTSAVEMSGRDYTGLYLDEIRFNKPDELLALYRQAAEERQPAFRSGVWHFPDGMARAFETAILPLSEDGEQVTQCLAIEDYQEYRKSPLTQWAAT